MLKPQGGTVVQWLAKTELSVSSVALQQKVLWLPHIVFRLVGQISKKV